MVERDFQGSDNDPAPACRAYRIGQRAPILSSPIFCQRIDDGSVAVTVGVALGVVVGGLVVGCRVIDAVRVAVAVIVTCIVAVTVDVTVALGVRVAAAVTASIVPCSSSRPISGSSVRTGRICSPL